MSIGPAPNLGGGLITVDVARCCGGLDSGIGNTFVGPTGLIPPPCNCNGNLGNGNDGCGCCCPANYGGTGNCGGGDGGGGGGSGCGNPIVTAYGAGAPESLTPGGGFACTQDLTCASYCCMQSQLHGDPGNAAYGTFFPAPAAGAAELGSGSGTGCLQPPPPVPVGLPTPPPVPTSSAPYSQGVSVESQVLHVLEPVLDVPIHCAETGVTMPSVCVGAAMFYFTTSVTYHYTTPAGSYSGCAGGGSGTPFGAGSGSGVPGTTIGIVIDTE